MADPSFDVGPPNVPRMGFPEPKGPFVKLPPSHFKVTIRKAQGFQVDQISKDPDLKLSKRTVSAYLERAKDKLGAETVQQLMFMVYQTYAPGLCPPYWEGTGPDKDEPTGTSAISTEEVAP